VSAPTPTPSTQGAGAADTGAPEEQPSPHAVLLALVLLLMPFPLVLKKLTSGNAGYDFQAILFPSDLPLIVLTVVMVPRLVGRIRARTLGLCAWLALALTAWMAVAFVAHPSQRGVADLVRLAGIVAIIVAIQELSTTLERTVVLGALGIVAVFETVVASIQLITRAPAGLNAVGEFKDPLWKFGSALAPQGTLVHPYVLAAFALVAGLIFAIASVQRRSWRLAAVAALAVAPVGFTFSRAALLGLAVALIVLGTGLLTADRARYVPAVVGLCVGAALTAGIWNAGWITRTHQTVSATGGASLTTDRGWLIHESKVLIGAHPVTGVGPGRYVIALKERYGHERNPHVGVFKPVHNMPLLVAAEGGVIGGLLMATLLIGAGWQALRAGRLGLALWVVYMPFSQLDHLGYSFPQGLIITGVWLGVIEFLATRPREAPASDRGSRLEDAPRTRSAGR
jgi:hypothetical protein